MTEHLQKKGKQVRIWNDGFLRKDLQSLVPLNKNVEVCYWTNWDKGMAEVKEWLTKGYTLINFCDNDLYYVLGEEAGYSYPTAEKLEREGKIQKFSGQQYLNQEEMKAVRGTYFSIWADNAAAKSVSEILDDLSKVLPEFMKIYGGNDE
ncbi:family 20 glycosylhydrolase [Lactococcus lactis]|uniref:family 20 glycosylhydrolase n=1 Tax=Lactococcus lactis TaxID=1358 RepID=UPI000728839E|nr:family 20 glycosylhydrolase [Lactococcus lactis]KSU13695.1 Beta-hexosaminidase [Lactococcus lactis subsp. lactis]